MPRPGGSPRAEYVHRSPVRSDALIVSETAVPVSVDCVPGFVTVGGLLTVMVHANWTLEMFPDGSVTRAVTRDVPPVAVTVPEIKPVEGLMLRPAGRFVALN